VIELVPAAGPVVRLAFAAEQPQTTPNVPVVGVVGGSIRGVA